MDSTRHLPPIFMIDGGPGVAVSNSAAFYADPVNLYRRHHDIVLVDVRGTGNSAPLHCVSLQFAASLDDQFGEMYPVEAVRSCYDSLSKQADLTQYNTTNMVKDLEEVRKWLGYTKISLMGLSFGTRVAQVYMRLFPESLAGVVLFSPITMGIHVPLYHARFAQDALEKLYRDCRDDSACALHFPNLKNEFEGIMNKWSLNPPTYTWLDSLNQAHRIRVGWHAFESKIRSLMYYPAGLRRIPYIIHEAYLGNLQPFMDLYPKGPSMDYFIAEGLYLCLACTEDVPFIKEEEIAGLVANTFMGTYRIDQQRQACENWSRGEISPDFFTPVTSDLPVLILTGAFDPVTPPALSKEIATTLSRSRVILIPWMSHIFDGLTNEQCFDKMVIDFLTHFNPGQVSASCVTEMKPPPYKVN